MTPAQRSLDTEALGMWRYRILGKYREMPGLKLRPDQGARFWGLDRTITQRLLDELCDRRVLVRTSDGAYRLP